MLNFNEKIIFKKFLIDNTYFFLFVSLSLTLIVWVIQAVNFLDFVSEDGHSFKIYFYYTLLNLPKIFSRIMPIVFFTSLFYTLIKYEENNELKIFWINGINKVKFINVLVKYTVLFFIIQIILNSFLAPHAQNKARSFIKNSNLDFFPSLIQEKKFIDTVENLTIFIDKKNITSNEFENIFLKDEISGEQSQIIYAKKGKLIDYGNSRSLKLFDGKFININNKKTTIFNFDQTDFDLSKFGTKSITHRKIQELESSTLLNCINNYYFKSDNSSIIYDPNCNIEFISEVKQEVFKRFFKPLYLFLVVSIVCFLLLSFKESYIYKSTRTFVFFASIIVLVISEISVNYSGKSDTNSLLAAFAPFALSLIFYLILINRLTFAEEKN